MLKVIATDAVISKGYNGAPALRFSENNSAVQFKIGKRVYDTRAEGNHRYINIAVKAFGPVCERAEKMKLKDGSYINILGRLDEEKWEENGQQFNRFVIIAEDIEYASNGGVKSNGNGENGTGSPAPNPPQNAQGQPPQNQSAPQDVPNGTPPGFTGFDSYGDENPFFPQN